MGRAIGWEWLRDVPQAKRQGTRAAAINGSSHQHKEIAFAHEELVSIRSCFLFTHTAVSSSVLF